MDNNATLYAVLCVIVLILIVCLIVWVVKRKKTPEEEKDAEDAKELKDIKESFQPGSSLAHMGVFDGANQGRGSNRAEEESMGGYEPPVFWNAGSVNAINSFQRTAVERTPVLRYKADDSPVLRNALAAARASGKESMSARIHRAAYTGLPDAFNARKLSPY